MRRAPPGGALHGDLEEAALQRGVVVGAHRAVVAQAAFVQDRHAVAHSGDLDQHVGGQDHRGARGGLFADQRTQHGDLHRIERVGRFVQHQQGGAVQQRAGEAEALALALRQRARQPPRQRLQFQPRQRRVTGRAQRRAGKAAQAAVGVQMLGHGELRPYRCALGQPAGQAARQLGAFQKILAVQADRAAVRPQGAGDHGQRGGLARAVDAQQAQHLAGRQRQAQILNGRAPGAAAGEAIELQYGWRGGMDGGHCAIVDAAPSSHNHRRSRLALNESPSARVIPSSNRLPTCWRVRQALT